MKNPGAAVLFLESLCQKVNEFWVKILMHNDKVRRRNKTHVILWNVFFEIDDALGQS